jgi:hypothetical protein
MLLASWEQHLRLPSERTTRSSKAKGSSAGEVKDDEAEASIKAGPAVEEEVSAERCVTESTMSFGIGPLRILDFDSENRALSYLDGDFATKELTGIAWSFGDPEHVEVRTLGFGDRPADVLEDFLEAYDRADVVTGHWLVGHDLPLINAMLLEDGHAPLSPKLVSDTKAHLLKRSGISASQKNPRATSGAPCRGWR